MIGILPRLKQDENQTLGRLILYEGTKKVFECCTLELPWLDNKPFISCITPGTYKVKIINSPTFGWCFRVEDVDRRYAILIHFGNYKRDTKGCILVGTHFKDINADGLADVISSKRTLERLLAITDEFTLTIIDL